MSGGRFRAGLPVQHPDQVAEATRLAREDAELAAMPLQHPDQVAEATRLAREDAELAAMPLRIRTCVECMRDGNLQDAGWSPAKVEAKLDACDLILDDASHGRADGSDAPWFQPIVAEAFTLVSTIAACKPAGWKLRVRAAKLMRYAGKDS